MSERHQSGCDVCVVIAGGGPVGLSLAIELGWWGVSCLLVEQRDGSISVSKMNLANIRVMEHCRRWGIEQEVRNAARVLIAAVRQYRSGGAREPDIRDPRPK